MGERGRTGGDAGAREERSGAPATWGGWRGKLHSFYIAAAVLAKPPTIRPRPVDMFLFENDMFLVRGNIVAHVPLKYIDQPVRSYRVSILLETCRLL